MAGADRILVHGHRGARAVRPENTLAAFEYALSVGVDVLELDVAVTKDNVLVVSHDPTLNSRICTGPKPNAIIRELTLSEVRAYDCGSKVNPSFPKQQPAPGARVPTLDEVFALADRGNFEFNVETKSFPSRPELTPPPEEFARLLLDAIRRHHLENRVIVQSFDFRTLHAMEKLAPEIRRSALYEGSAKPMVDIAREGHARIVSPAFKLATAAQVAEAHAAGIAVVPWTANKASDWDALIEARVDAIISDDPAALIAHLRSRGLR